MVLAAVLAARCAGLVLPRHTLSPKLERGAPSTTRGAPLYAQVDEELQETVEKSGVRAASSPSLPVKETRKRRPQLRETY